MNYSVLNMKRIYFIISLALVATMAVSCGQNGAKKGLEKSKEEVTEAKVELMDDILSTVDSLEQRCVESGQDYETVIGVITSALTPEQRLVKPDYLLDPSRTSELLSLRQKVNALAILLTERPIREAYNMPLGPVDKAISKLYVEVGHPVVDIDGEEITMSERIERTYKICKENDEVCYFWLFDTAVQQSLLYLISFNSDTFFDNITPEQYSAFNTRISATIRAAEALAPYDKDVASAYAFHENAHKFSSNEEAESVLASKENGKQMIDSRHKDYIEYRAFVLL